MSTLPRLFWLLFLLPSITGSANVPLSPGYCPLHGLIFPRAKHLPNDTAFISACDRLSASLNQTLESGNWSSNSISLQIFDTNHAGSLFEFTSTSEFINTTLGGDKVDENTVFRIGSVSKLWTVFLMLIERGLAPFPDRVIQYIPELFLAAVDMRHNETKRKDHVDFLHWYEVTIGELASQLAGVARDYGIGDLAEQGPALQLLGFPALPAAEIPPCGTGAPCNRRQFFRGILDSHPVVPISSTPIYSNAAFQILGYVLEVMTGQSYEHILQRDLIKPLGLTRTFYNTPDPKLGVIPDFMGEFWWNFQLGDEGPAGSIYASTKDMATVGRAILRNTLLPLTTTRRWLKPAAFTSDQGYAVGAPWEIVPLENFRTVDVYTKAGDIGVYSANIALLPDHGVGFTVLVSGNNTHSLVASVSDLISTALLPALDESAKEEAQQRFAGTYALTQGLNSSIIIATDEGPGLVVTSWISNSTNMFESLASLQGGLDPSLLSIRLYPTGLESPGQISFRAVIQQISTSGEKGGPFTGVCNTWLLVGAQVYGNVAIDEFLFVLNKDGMAVSVSPRTLRVSLPKV